MVVWEIESRIVIYTPLKPCIYEKHMTKLPPCLNQLTQRPLTPHIPREDHKRYTAVPGGLFVASPQRDARCSLAND